MNPLSAIPSTSTAAAATTTTGDVVPSIASIKHQIANLVPPLPNVGPHLTVIGVLWDYISLKFGKDFDDFVKGKKKEALTKHVELASQFLLLPFPTESPPPPRRRGRGRRVSVKKRVETPRKRGRRPGPKPRGKTRRKPGPKPGFKEARKSVAAPFDSIAAVIDDVATDVEESEDDQDGNASVDVVTVSDDDNDNAPMVVAVAASEVVVATDAAPAAVVAGEVTADNNVDGDPVVLQVISNVRGADRIEWNQQAFVLERSSLFKKVWRCTRRDKGCTVRLHTTRAIGEVELIETKEEHFHPLLYGVNRRENIICEFDTIEEAIKFIRSSHAWRLCHTNTFSRLFSCVMTKTCKMERRIHSVPGDNVKVYELVGIDHDHVYTIH